MTIMAYSRCTERSGFQNENVANNLKPDVTYGPDGTQWTLLTGQALGDFCSGAGASLEHRGKSFYDHVCAKYGSWGFDARDSTHVCCCVFLNYQIKKAANKLLGDVDQSGGAKIFRIKGATLLEKYLELNKLLNNEQNNKVNHAAVHVWQRSSQGEIAIDFCLR